MTNGNEEKGKRGGKGRGQGEKERRYRGVISLSLFLTRICHRL